MKKSIFSILIVLVMVFTTTGSALGDFAKKVTASGDGNGAGGMYAEILDAEEEGLSVTAYDGASTNVSVRDDIEANTGGIYVNATDTSSNTSDLETEATVTVGGDIIVTDDTGNDSAYGIKAESNAYNPVDEVPSQSYTEATVDGSVYVEGSKNVEGVYMKTESDAPDGTAVLCVKIGDDITVVGHDLTQFDNEATGVKAITYAGSYTSADALSSSAETTFASEGSLTVNAEGKATGINALTTVRSDGDTTAATTINVDGYVAVSGEDEAVGIDVSAYSENAEIPAVSIVNIGGDVIATATYEYGTAVGVDFSENGFADQKINIDGNVIAVSDNYYAMGITANGVRLDEHTVNYSDVDISAKGVEATSNLYAVGVQSDSVGGTASINIGEGGVYASGSSYAYGIEAYALESNETNINVDGNVETQSDATHNNAIYVEGYDESLVFLNVNGDVISEATATEASDENDYVVGIDANGYRGSEVYINTGSVTARGGGQGTGAALYEEDAYIRLFVDGDVTGSEIGLFLSAGTAGTAELGESELPPEVEINEPDGNIEVVVTGTISGGNKAIVLDGDKDYKGDIAVYAWKIESGDNGSPAVSYKESTGETNNDEDFNKNSIWYFIKTEQPAEGGTLSISDENGNKLTENYGYGTAKEGAIVLLKVQVDDGYDLKGAYNGVGEVLPLLKDSNENYYVQVPRGGGVYLTADISKREEPIVVPKEEPKVEPAAEPAVAPVPVVKEETPVVPAKEPSTEPIAEIPSAPVVKPAEVPQEEPKADATVSPVNNTAVEAVVKTGNTSNDSINILEIRDTQHRIRITFSKNGTYRVLMEDGTLERGTYKSERGILVLMSNGVIMNAYTENGIHKIDYRSYKSERSYTFEISDADYEKLLNAVK